IQALTLLGTGNQTVRLVIDRDGQQQTLAVNGSAVMRSIVNADPLYRAGLIVDDRHPAMMIVQRVFPGTPAFYAGLRQADVISSINGGQIPSLAELTKALRLGGNLSLVITRNEQTRQMAMPVAPERVVRSSLRSPSSEESILRWTTPPGAFARGAF